MRFLAVVWLSATAGCGDGVVPPDAGSSSSTRGTVSVRVSDEAGVGTAGCQVLFQSLDSLVEGTAITGSDGMATAEMTDGGFVTVVDGDNMTTFGGVANGDVLAVPHPTTLPRVELTFVGPPNSAYQYGWTTCGFMYPVTDSTVDVDQCDSSVDVLFETFAMSQATFQTVALVDSATIDLTLPLVDEIAETVSILNGSPDASVQQWLITSRGRLKFDVAEAPSSTLHQPSIPGATFKTIVRSSASRTGILVIDPPAPMAAYQLDLADVLPSAVGLFKTDFSDVHWHDEGQRPADFVVGLGAGWTLIAPIAYSDTDAVLHVPTLPGLIATPTLESVTTVTDGETYDAVRAHAAELWLGVLTETEASGLRLSGLSTPSRRVIAQTIGNCAASQDCE